MSELMRKSGRQTILVPYLSQEHRWNYLLGIPVKDKLKNWDMYGEIGEDHTRSYYMTGKFGFSGYWRAGRCPDWHFDEVYTFAHEDCDIKEKWKRMVIWNRLFDCDKETLLLLRKTTKSERKHYVICKLLEIKGEKVE